MRVLGIRFQGEGKAPHASKKTYENLAIVVPLAKVLRGETHDQGEAAFSFAEAWTQDPKGAITTLGNLVDDVTHKLHAKAEGPRGMKVSLRSDAAFVSGRLARFLAFFRREFWDATFPGALLREFNTPVSRSDAVLRSALSKGIPPRQGAWEAFCRFAREKAGPEFHAAMAEKSPVVAQMPPPQHPVWASYGGEEKEAPPFVSPHVNDFPPEDDKKKFLDFD